ncbi:hypothetical protein [Methylobacterium nigriterrae]|uniref:hypothetical protein n=1 Tax=Methylobacterium nigriterrae TaxID=3127512 RepID=UPI0030137491
MRVFDCLLYNGEIDILEIRLHELAAVVDVVVIVEATRTFSGLPKPLRLRAQWDRIRPFTRKIRYVVVDDDIASGDAWAREQFQRNCVTRGLLDAHDDDLVLASDVDEIPRASAIEAIRREGSGCFGLVLDLSYFALNYRHCAGPEVDLKRAVVCPHALLRESGPDALRYAVQNGTIPARRVPDAGWHFSYLSDLEGIKRKIREFSHQEYNTPDFLSGIDPLALIAARRDLFGRGDYAWEISGEERLPEYVRSNRDRFAHRILTPEGRFAASEPARAEASARRPEPVILCPYVHEADRDRVVAAFGLDEDRGRRLPVHLWQDTAPLGPGRAVEQGWKAFPNRDVVILRTGMAPMPDDAGNTWYERLLAAVEALPAAGLVGCDLLFPLKAPTGEWYAQCAGGYFEDARIGQFGGSVDLRAGTAGPVAYRYDGRFAAPRPADWVTFGGVYIRREVIDMVGDPDPGYRSAGVMDADYALEARIRGIRCWQVPVTLLHGENGSTCPTLDDPAYAGRVAHDDARFQEKWKDLLGRSGSGLWTGARPGPAQGASGIGPAPASPPSLSPWRAAQEAALLAEARAAGPAFAVAAYARALAAADAGASTEADVARAYRLVLGREIDPTGAAAWRHEVGRRSVPAAELVAALCASPEYAALSAREHGG